jgi:membrane-associated protein
MLSFLTRLGPFAPVIVFVAALTESAAFLGLIVPGELMVLVGGALAGTGGVPLPVILVAAITGAIAGDAIGYTFGRRYGVRLLERPAFSRFAPQVERAAHFLEHHGWWALVLARFASMLRAVVPFAAGAGKMPYAKFAVGNIIGSITWGAGVSGLGYWAGSRWSAVEAFVQRGGIGLAALLVAVGLLVVAARWLARNRPRVERAMASLRRHRLVGPLVALAVTTRGAPRPYLRVMPHLMIATAAVAVFAVGGLVDWSFVEARAIESVSRIDAAMAAFAAEASTLLRAVPWAAIGAAVILAVVGRLRPSLFVASSVAGALILSAVLERLTDRAYGPIDLELVIPDAGFPDVVATAAAALAMALAWPWGSGWVRGVTRISSGLLAVMLIVAARTFAQHAYPVDAIAGATLGMGIALWLGLWFDERVWNNLSLEPQPQPVHAAVA